MTSWTVIDNLADEAKLDYHVFADTGKKQPGQHPADNRILRGRSFIGGSLCSMEAFIEYDVSYFFRTEVYLTYDKQYAILSTR